MFVIKGNRIKPEAINSFMKDFDLRMTAFLKRFVITVADNFAKQIKGRYKNLSDEEAKLISENIEAFFVKYKKAPAPDKGEVKKITNTIERHYSAVMVHAVKRKASDNDVNTTIVKVLANKKSLPQSPPSVFFLVRYGPWTIDTLPFIPKDVDATILFVKAPTEQVSKIKDKNEKQSSFIRDSLLKLNIKLTSPEESRTQLDGYDSLDFWVLKKEFGIDARKQSVWKPAIDYMYKEGYKKIIALEPSIFKLLFDPNFKDYKKPESGYKIVDDQYIEDTHHFQERFR
jgi:hypothetical protein